MTRLRIVALLWLAAASGVCADSRQLRLAWNDLKDWTGPQFRLNVLTTEGVRLEAQLNAVQDDQLVLAVLKSSDSTLYAPGETVLKRAAIQELAVRRQRNSARQKGCMIGLFLAALNAPFAAQGTSTKKQMVGVIAMGSAFYCGIGYLIGREMDNAWTPVALLPSPSSLQAERTGPE
jgi:hypothetical protein